MISFVILFFLIDLQIEKSKNFGSCHQTPILSSKPGKSSNFQHLNVTQSINKCHTIQSQTYENGFKLQISTPKPQIFSTVKERKIKFVFNHSDFAKQENRSCFLNPKYQSFPTNTSCRNFPNPSIMVWPFGVKC